MLYTAKGEYLQASFAGPSPIELLRVCLIKDRSHYTHVSARQCGGVITFTEFSYCNVSEVTKVSVRLSLYLIFPAIMLHAASVHFGPSVLFEGRCTSV